MFCRKDWVHDKRRYLHYSEVKLGVFAQQGQRLAPLVGFAYAVQKLCDCT